MRDYNDIQCIRLNSSKRKMFKAKGYYFVKNPKKSKMIFNYKDNAKFDDLASLAQLIRVDEDSLYDQELYDFIKNYPNNKTFYVFENNSVYATGEFLEDAIEKDGEVRRKSTFPIFKACLLPKRVGNVDGFSFRVNKYFYQEFLDSRLHTKKDKIEEIDNVKSDETTSKKKKKRKGTRVIVTITRNDGVEVIGDYNPTAYEKKEIEQEIKKYGNVVTPLYRSPKYQSCVDAIKKKVGVPVNSIINKKNSFNKNVQIIENKEIINAVRLKNEYSPRISKTNYNDYRYLLKEEVIGKIELIEDVHSHNRHLSHKFDLNGVVKDFAYEDINGKINIVKLAVFYCETCNVYFDYVESYKAQLKNANIPLIRVIAKHVDHYGREIRFDGFKNWKEESTLKHFGYAVGYSGLSQIKRHEILKFVIQNHFMSINEVKKLLNQLIAYNGQKMGNERAKKDWETDLAYVNELLVSSKNKKLQK